MTQGKLKLYDSNYVAELEYALNEQISSLDHIDLPAMWQEYLKMCADPGWQSDTTFAPPNFLTFLTG